MSLSSWTFHILEMGFQPDDLIAKACARFGFSPDQLTSNHLLIEALVETNDRIKKLEEELACMKQGKNSST